MPLSIVFMGTPEFAVPALKGLIHSDHDVVAAYTQPPRPANRGQQLTPSPIHKIAEANDIPVFTPVNFKSRDDVAKLQSLKADIAVVAAYGLLLPKAVLDAFPKGCINIHPSALPRWRGAAPIHRTVLAGDAETAVCIMQMDEGLDTGAVLAEETFDVPPTATTGWLHDFLAKESVPLLLGTLDAIDSGLAHAKAQSEDGVTYAKKITKEESRIDWSLPASEIANKVRGLNPYPIAVTKLNKEPFKIWEAEIVEKTSDASAGTVIDDALTVTCGEGALRLTLVQRPGKKPMPAEELLRGTPIPVGTKLG